MMLVEARGGLRRRFRGVESCYLGVWSSGLSGLRCRGHDDVRVLELVFVFEELLICGKVCRMTSRCLIG